MPRGKSQAHREDLASDDLARPSTRSRQLRMSSSSKEGNAGTSARAPPSDSSGGPLRQGPGKRGSGTKLSKEGEAADLRDQSIKTASAANPMLAMLLNKLSNNADDSWKVPEPRPPSPPDWGFSGDETSSPLEEKAKPPPPRFQETTLAQTKAAEMTAFLYGVRQQKKTWTLTSLAKAASRPSLRSPAASPQSAYDGDRSVESVGADPGSPWKLSNGGDSLSSSGGFLQSPIAQRTGTASASDRSGVVPPLPFKLGEAVQPLARLSPASPMMLGRDGVGEVATGSKRLPSTRSKAALQRPVGSEGVTMGRSPSSSTQAGVPGYLRMTKSAEILKAQTAYETLLFGDGCVLNGSLFNVPDAGAKLREPLPPRVFDTAMTDIMEYARAAMNLPSLAFLSLEPYDVALPLISRWNPKSASAGGGLRVTQKGTRVERVSNSDGRLGIVSTHTFTVKPKQVDDRRWRSTSPIFLVPTVPERFTWVVEFSEDDDMYIGLSGEGVDPSDCHNLEVAAYRSNGIIRAFGNPFEPSPRYGTGDVIMLDYVAKTGMAHFLLNGKQVSPEFSFQQTMRPWVALGTKGQIVTTGELLPGNIGTTVCRSCFARVGNEGLDSSCTQGGEDGGEWVGADGQKTRTSDILMIDDEKVDGAVWVAGKLLCCNCVLTWGQFNQDTCSSPWYQEFGCRRCKIRRGWPIEKDTHGVKVTNLPGALHGKGEAGANSGGKLEDEEEGMERDEENCKVKRLLGHTLRPKGLTSLVQR